MVSIISTPPTETTGLALPFSSVFLLTTFISFFTSLASTLAFLVLERLVFETLPFSILEFLAFRAFAFESSISFAFFSFASLISSFFFCSAANLSSSFFLSSSAFFLGSALHILSIFSFSFLFDVFITSTFPEVFVLSCFFISFILSSGKSAAKLLKEHKVNKETRAVLVYIDFFMKCPQKISKSYLKCK